MADQTVRIKLAAEDAASPNINKVKQGLSGLATSSGVAGGLVGGLVAGGLMSVANAAMQAIPAIAGTVVELGQLSAQAGRTESAFKTLASGVGQSASLMLSSMQKWTAGTVADTDLMLAANRAMMLGVSDNADEMGKLMAAAIEHGRALGVSSQQAVNDIITGIGRMSPMILDNLGIVGVTASVEEYARSLGKTADALTDVEKKQALVNAVISSGSGFAVLDDAASSFEKMNASIDNMKVALGDLFGPAIAQIAQQLADAVSGVNAAIDTNALQSSQSELFQLGDTLTGLMDAYDGAISKMQEAAIAADGAGMKEAATQAEMLMMSIEAVAGAYNTAAAATGAPLIDVAALQRGEIAFMGVKAAIDDVGSAAAVAKTQVDILNAALSNASPIISGVGNIRNAAISRVESLGLQAVSQGADPSEVTAMVANATDAIWNMGLSYDATTEAQFANKLAVESQLDPLQSLTDKLSAADKAASKMASGGLSDAERAFGTLKSRVESMLSGALSPGVSIVDGIMPRTDDINENARRLADIANIGIGDQSWMEEFKSEVPGIFDEIVNAANPQAAAAEIFAQFQAGLRPELIDKDLVKQRIRDAIIGENNMAALAEEIATELAAEMNMSLPEALAAVQGAMGVSPTGGGDMGGGFVDGVDGAEIASGSLAKIAKAFLDNESNVRTSGGVVGAWWGEGFMAVVGDNVPQGLLDMMTAKLLPYILAAIANRGSTSAPSDAGANGATNGG